MSATQKLTVFAINVRSGISSKTGRPYTLYDAQCMLTEGVPDALGKITETVHVGRVNVSETLKDTVPGEYVADFKLRVSREGELIAQIVELKPLNGRPVAQPVKDKIAA